MPTANEQMLTAIELIVSQGSRPKISHHFIKLDSTFFRGVCVRIFVTFRKNFRYLCGIIAPPPNSYHKLSTCTSLDLCSLSVSVSSSVFSSYDKYVPIYIYIHGKSMEASHVFVLKKIRATKNI